MSIIGKSPARVRGDFVAAPVFINGWPTSIN